MLHTVCLNRKTTARANTLKPPYEMRWEVFLSEWVENRDRWFSREKAQVGVLYLPLTCRHTPACSLSSACCILCIYAETHISTAGFQGDECAAVILSFMVLTEDSLVK